MKKRIELLACEGSDKCYLEIERLENGDIFAEMKGQITKGETYIIRAQQPNPITGGGNFENYKKLLDMLRA